MESMRAIQRTGRAAATAMATASRAAAIAALGIGAAALTAAPALAAPPDVQAVQSATTAAQFNLTQSEANRLSIFHDYDISSIGTTTGNFPAARNGGLLGPLLGDWAAAPEDLPSPSGPITPSRNWFVAATPIVGYDSNPQALNAAKSSPFLGADVAAGYDIGGTLPGGNPLNMVFGYDLTGAFYRGETLQADNIQQTASADIQHSIFNDTIRMNLLFRDQFTVQHGQSFLNSIDAAPAMEFFFLPNVSIEGGYEFSHLDYFFPLALSAQDPDTARHTLSAALHLFPLPQPKGAPVPPSPDILTDILRRSLRSMTVGYDHVWNVSDGSDYVYESNRIRFGLDGISPFPSNALTMDFDYAHEWQNYMNFSTMTRPLLEGRNLVRRHDHLDIFTTRLNADLATLAEGRGALGAYLQWDLISDRSNILARDFNEYLVSAGITYRY